LDIKEFFNSVKNEKVNELPYSQKGEEKASCSVSEIEKSKFSKRKNQQQKGNMRTNFAITQNSITIQ